MSWQIEYPRRGPTHKSIDLVANLRFALLRNLKVPAVARQSLAPLRPLLRSSPPQLMSAAFRVQPATRKSLSLRSLTCSAKIAGCAVDPPLANLRFAQLRSAAFRVRPAARKSLSLRSLTCSAEAAPSEQPASAKVGRFQRPTRHTNS
ncbi:hypothetical protein SDC9_39897 [bioreactor metagenome]|uniref:Uncharacterized protein n=1 Tax=bioreactor metagenome TaxID=1076179 RepID=A0A644VRC8_9ZZZZ